MVQDIATITTADW